MKRPSRLRYAPLRFMLLALFAAALLPVGGCFLSSGTESSSGSSPGSELGSAPAGASPVSSATGNPGPSADAAGLTFGIIYPMAHSFYEMITQDAKAAAGAAGVNLIVKAPDEANLEQQIRMMETMIKMKVDGIAIDPVDAEALVPVIDKAADAGIPVVCFESDAPGSRRLGYIGADNFKSGERMGQTLGRLLDNEGMVLVETGMSRMDSLSQRLDGMLAYLNRETEIQVLEVRYNEGKEAAALSNLEEMIEAHPHFDAFVALDAMSGSASVLVWKASGLSRYALTFGMMPDIEEAMANGQITAAISQNEADWGGRIVSRLLDAARGRSVPPFDDTGIAERTPLSP